MAYLKEGQRVVQRFKVVLRFKAHGGDQKFTAGEIRWFLQNQYGLLSGARVVYDVKEVLGRKR